MCSCHFPTRRCHAARHFRASPKVNCKQATLRGVCHYVDDAHARCASSSRCVASKLHICSLNCCGLRDFVPQAADAISLCLSKLFQRSAMFSYQPKVIEQIHATQTGMLRKLFRVRRRLFNERLLWSATCWRIQKTGLEILERRRSKRGCPRRVKDWDGQKVRGHRRWIALRRLEERTAETVGETRQSTKWTGGKTRSRSPFGTTSSMPCGT